MASRKVLPAVVLTGALVASVTFMRAEPEQETANLVGPQLMRQADATVPEDARSLPLLDTDFPARVNLYGSTVPLAERPVRRALALFQGGPDAPVLVLGEDGSLRSLSVASTRTSAGGVVQALRPTSLSADGRTAVFPQPGAVLVVDLTTGSSRRVPVPGANAHAAISPDGGQLLVVNGRGTLLLDAADGALIIRMADRSRPSSYSATDTVACGVSMGRRNPEIMLSAFRGPERAGRTISHSLQPMVDDVHGIPAARGKRIAVSGTGGFSSPGVIVMTYFSFTPMAGAPPKALGLPHRDMRPLRWLDDSVLLVWTGSQVLSWNVDTSEVRRVMDVVGYTELAI